MRTLNQINDRLMAAKSKGYNQLMMNEDEIDALCFIAQLSYEYNNEPSEEKKNNLDFAISKFKEFWEE